MGTVCWKFTDANLQQNSRLYLTQFRPSILKNPSRSQLQVDDASLLLFEAYKDFDIWSVLPMDLDFDEELSNLWAVLRRAGQLKIEKLRAPLQYHIWSEFFIH